jgi:hypothetical protein
MRFRTICLLSAAAIVMGVASPYLTGVALDDQYRRIPFLYDWFYLVPGVLNHWLDPESDTAFMALHMAVLTVQYLIVFVAVPPAVSLAGDFLRPHKHRGRLVDRRA